MENLTESKINEHVQNLVKSNKCTVQDSQKPKEGKTRHACLYHNILYFLYSVIPEKSSMKSEECNV